MAKPSTTPSKTKAVAVKSKAKRAPAKSPSPPKRKRPAHAALAPDDRLQRLWDAVQAVREGRHTSPRTARLIAAGAPKMAQKVVEEAAEVAIEAVQGRREALINESVDLLYNLAALWNGSGVRLEDLWAEMDRREAAFGMSEKLPKTDDV
jgi:phosphoribosyl-ATP pyrophosphohydrolase